jgi:two-component system sensor histidine kinase BaeS
MLLNHLVDDLQELALVEGSQLRLNQQSVQLSDEVNKTISITQPEADMKGINLKANIPPDLPAVSVDPERLKQVLRNLLENSLAYTPEHGNVYIEAHSQNGMVQVSVKDSGIGIAPDHLPYIFERFYRADRSRARSTGGAGLGLAIVKKIVEAHGGQVSAESVLEKGTTINFTLPTIMTNK